MFMDSLKEKLKEFTFKDRLFVSSAESYRIMHPSWPPHFHAIVGKNPVRVWLYVDGMFIYMKDDEELIDYLRGMV